MTSAPTLSLDVRSFTFDNFADALRNEYCSAAAIKTRTPVNYLYAYLEEMGAAAILVEHEYVDGDYLEDFSKFYVKCFSHYRKRCKRIHFFSREIDRSLLRDLLLLRDIESRRREVAELSQSYLGFIVARPLPRAVIGRTVLRSYETDNGRRQFTAVLTYKISLFGLDLEVENALAFQEQDSTLAACATVALWSAFHKLAPLFGSAVLKPAAITLAANSLIHPKRPIPSRGLNTSQMLDAINHVGLEAEILEIRPNQFIDPIAVVYAYARMGLPVILGLNIEGDGKHAVTVVGYSMGRERGDRKANGSLPTRAPYINSIYVHDDQVGPYAGLTIGVEQNELTLRTKSGTVGWDNKMTCEIIIIPLYEKIRVGYLDLLKTLHKLHSLLLSFFLSLRCKADDLEWDVYLTTVNDQKREWLNGKDPRTERLLVRPQPRFIWRATLLFRGAPALEILADATDMLYSCIYAAIWHVPVENDHRQFFTVDTLSKFSLPEHLVTIIANSTSEDNEGMGWDHRFVGKEV